MHRHAPCSRALRYHESSSPGKGTFAGWGAARERRGRRKKAVMVRGDRREKDFIVSGWSGLRLAIRWSKSNSALVKSCQFVFGVLDLGSCSRKNGYLGHREKKALAFL